MQTSRRNKGFTLIETLTYAAGLIVILAGMVAFIYSMYNWYRSATIPARADQIALEIMSRVMADVRAADTINDGASLFGVAGGMLSITSSMGASATTTVYSLNDGAIVARVNSAATSTYSSADATITSFLVRKLSTPISQAVRVELGIEYADKAGTTTRTYSDMAILRQSYE